MYLRVLFLPLLINQAVSTQTADSSFALSYLARQVDEYCDLRCNCEHVIDSAVQHGARISSCLEATRNNANMWNGTGGSFDIFPGTPGRKLQVYCDLTTDNGGWTVFQRRMDGSENFHRLWAEYVIGFGDVNKEFWLGLEKISSLTSSRQYELRIDLEDWGGNKFFAQYSEFSIGNASEKYKLHVSGYIGTAGDSLTSGHSGQMFSTKDQDNDSHAPGNCAIGHGGGWWFSACDASDLNGNYHVGGTFIGGENGVEWTTLKNTGFYSMKFTEMKFRPKL